MRVAVIAVSLGPGKPTINAVVAEDDSRQDQNADLIEVSLSTASLCYDLVSW